MLDAMYLAALRFTDLNSIFMLLTGVIMGISFGALPGLGSVVCLAIALPFTFGMEPMLAMFLYAGIMSSCTFGGSVPAILLNTPGTAPNAMTCFDGYPMAQRGQGARAISISATSCFVGSLAGAVFTIALIPAVKPIVFAFGPPEFFWLVAFGLVMIAFASKGNMVKGLIGGGIGILISMIGYSEMYGSFRFTFGSDYLWDGVPLVPFVVGVFAVSELINYGGRGGSTASGAQSEKKIVWRGQIVQGIMDVLSRPIVWIRSALIGTGIGIIPGLGGGVASFMSYAVGAQHTKESELYGKGSIEGVISSETANDAKESGALLPTVSFGIPGSPDMAVLLGAFILHGLQPGPMLLRNNLDMVFALLFGIVISQIFTSGIGLLTAPWLARISVLKNRWIAPFVITLVIGGTYMLRASILDVGLAIISGFLCYALKRFGYPLITIAIGYILGPLAEKSFLQSLIISEGKIDIFFKKPISLVLMLLTLAALVFPILSIWKERKRQPSAKTEMVFKTGSPGQITATAVLTAIALLTLILTYHLPVEVQLMPAVVGIFTFCLLILVFIGEFSPFVARWTRANQDDQQSASSESTECAKKESPIPWPTVLGVIVMISAYFLLVFFFGFYVVPVFTIAAYLVLQADVKFRYAVIPAVIVHIAIVLSMRLLMVDVWTGVFPEIIPYYIGGAVMPNF